MRPFLTLALLALAGSASAGDLVCNGGSCIPRGDLLVRLGDIPQPKIIGGYLDADDHGYACAYIRRSNVGHYFAHCSAVLIGPRVALTAAHCAWSGATERMLDGLSCSAKIDPDAEWRNIRGGTLYVDPEYRKDSSSHDFAVIVLDDDAFTPMQLRVMIRAHISDPTWSPYAQLPRENQLDSEHATMTVVGYGVTDDDQDPNQYANTRRQALASYAKSGEDTFRLDDHTCWSDSGGPALRGRTVMGVLSAGTNGSCSGQAIYSRVDRKLAFIAKFLP